MCVWQLAGQSSSSTLQIKTEELSRQYRDQLAAMREEKDREIQRLRVRIPPRLARKLASPPPDLAWPPSRPRSPPSKRTPAADPRPSAASS